MTEATPDDPAARDPFLGPLRRAHPDVDVVVLPPEPLAAPSTLDSYADAAAVGDHVHAVARRLGGVLDHPAEPVSAGWWRTGAAHRYVVRVVFAEVAADELEPRLQRLGRHLLDDGWDAGARPGTDPLLVEITGRRGPVDVRVAGYRTASATGVVGTVELRLEGAPLMLDAATVRRLEQHAGEGRPA